MKGFPTLLLSAVIALLNGNAGVVAEPIPLGARAAPVVDLGYSKYEGTYDATTKINTFKGIRYAAPPLGKLRWQAPKAPATNRTVTFPATSDPPVCPQSGAGADTPSAYGFLSGPGNEDCLFLNVFAPAKANKLPVFFWIHGGGYALYGASGLDPSPFMTNNNNGFISVVIQYRLGAFGFLAGSDIKEDGALNAGLLDMNFALQWVQANIKRFGGDPARVTIAGESAGAAAVLYQAMAYGGKQPQALFQNLITASPWIPNQYRYNDGPPSKAYDDFAEAAGCANAYDTLKCLRNANTTVLQSASAHVSEASPFGGFAFLPVTDGVFIQQRPTQQLMSKKLNGKRLLSGNMANEGIPLSPFGQNTLQKFRHYISSTFPGFSHADKTALEKQYSYAGDQQDTDPSDPLFATSGTSYPSSVNQSEYATGQEQRVFNVFAEYAFDCPSYWLASAFPQAWKYQFSIPPSYHGYDLQALWKGTTTPNAAFKYAFHKVWGSFIIANSPVISVADAKAGQANATVPEGYGGKINWPQWSPASPVLLSLNTTGGVPVPVTAGPWLKYNLYVDPGQTNNFKIADAFKWEGGRGGRCNWWQSVAAKVPY
ncbi:alpha/beta-hydrolase [Amniculicola lignicola CBS 123094]|uniref:Carboxylic ester hydrolase n=1 Tax=Amniculicola lignicola CBS 123094 TaxID=1392246 RepID=A0A6A5WWR3_9PLEO|nr:alpha/beta-hydrolase [Amniculicola lignicola CBS 123094]